MTEDPLPLGPDEVSKIVEKKATCLFVDTGVATGQLPVYKEGTNPLASIEDVRRLGNAGGGDLGDLLVLVATGNHAFMRGPDGRLDQKAPDGLFSLEFPGSQGSHFGHSAILEGDPEELDSGRFSLPDFQRLADLAVDGLIKRSAVGRFIADNLHRDPKSKVIGTSVAELLAHDLGQFVASLGPDLLERLRGPKDESLHREIDERLTKLTGEDNLAGSSGEYGLLFAFLANSPRTKWAGSIRSLRIIYNTCSSLAKAFPARSTGGQNRCRYVRTTATVLSRLHPPTCGSAARDDRRGPAVLATRS